MTDCEEEWGPECWDAYHKPTSNLVYFGTKAHVLECVKFSVIHSPPGSGAELPEHWMVCHTVNEKLVCLSPEEVAAACFDEERDLSNPVEEPHA